MTDTVAEKAASRKKKDDLPVQVSPPQVIQDPLYAEVIGSLERDLHESRDRAHTAENKVRELSKIHDEVELLRDQVERMRNELDTVKTLVVQGNQYTEAMYKIVNKVFRS